MSLKDKMEKFNKRWDIASTDSYEVAFNKFKTRILNIFEDIDSHITDESVTEFCQYYGIREVWREGSFDRLWSSNIIERLKAEENEKEFYRLIEVIFALHITQTAGFHGGVVYSRGILYQKIVDAVNLSDINLAITARDDEVILYPKGEKLLDNEIINNVLSFLNIESNKHFEDALKFYQLKNFIKSAESLRRSLEEFLRYKLDNKKGLSANILEIQTKIKSDGRDAQIRNIIGSVFAYLDKYFDENSKHNDGDIDEIENEFLIYQIGLLLRYIYRLKL